MKYQSSGNAIQVCDSSTGHSVKNIAFCENGTIANELCEKANATDELCAALNSAIAFIGYQASVEEIKDRCIKALELAGKPYC